MSIRDIRAEWEVSGTLRPLMAAYPIGIGGRCLYVTENVERALLGPWASIEEEDRLSRARSVVDAFINGMTMAVRMPPSRSVRAQLALLDPGDECVWEFRTNAPKYTRVSRFGVRIFGMFMAKDNFIALCIEFKENLLKDDDYMPSREFCKREWRKLFPSYSPNLGSKMDDYISNGAVSR